MLLGFISLLLTVFQGRIVKLCVRPDIMKHLLPCSLSSESASGGEESNAAPEVSGHHRRLLAEEAAAAGYCAAKDKVPLLSLEALHHLHIFIFVLAIVHVTFSVLTIIFGGAKIRQWKYWEDSIGKDNYDTEQALPKVTHVHQHDFIKKRFLGLGRHSAILSWLHSFLKQFYGSVTKSDYATLRLGFIMTHCRGNPKFNFHKYMIRALEDDFKRVVGISWYLWIFVIIFLLLNINGWHTYFWIAFVPFILLLAVGTKLEHVISQLAHEVAEKHIAIEGELVVKPSDDHFWFHRPQIVLFLIHFILFQNAFEIAFFFWILVQYGFDSCIMGQVRYIVPRLIIGVFIQVLCSYSTLPLYALVTQMGTYFKKAIFDEHVQVGLVGWAQKAKKRKGLKATLGGSTQGGSTNGPSIGVQMAGIGPIPPLCLQAPYPTCPALPTKHTYTINQWQTYSYYCVLGNGDGCTIRLPFELPIFFLFHPKARFSLVVKVVNQRRNVCCLAVQESSTSTAEAVAAETKEKKTLQDESDDTAADAAPKPKAAAKAPAKALPQLMDEDVIPALKATLEAQQDISQLQLSFNENKSLLSLLCISITAIFHTIYYNVEGALLKKGSPYTFWAFFPDGINGPKGFSLSSYGSGVSTVEPFLVDEKKPTAKHVVFWVEKRLAAQGIIPVWSD
ncbi:UNVERIFIED_CONTAM: MLO-like protein 1 [Sesamum radiatum]|uniref:MLO-like protein 1 n=1 Tax=Sesamum radiatum TaxID=300843 RepID=A0AAW2UM80_SESRA